jgi:uncharacterized integral membrane protein
MKLIVGVVIGGVLALFGAQNAQPVSLHFFGWESLDVPLVLALGVALLIGAVLSAIFAAPGQLHGWRERRALERRIPEVVVAPAPAAPVPAAPAHVAPTTASTDATDDRGALGA